MKVIVIGSGLSGLTAGALMAKEGHSVKVFEQHEKIGGVCSSTEKDGFKWDYGQMLVPDLGKGEPGRKILEKLGVSDEVKVRKGYRLNYFPDFWISKPTKYKGIYWRKKFFKGLFPEDSTGLDEYYKLYDRVLDLSALFNKKGLLSKLKLLFTFLPLRGKKEWSAQQLMDHFFSNEKLQAVYTAILADYVISPHDFPGLIIPTINVEGQYDERIPLDYNKHQHRSSWTFVINGVSSLVRALSYALDVNGGEIITNTEITKINVENDQVKSVRTSDRKEYEADIIIASGGARELFIDLIGKERLPEDFFKTYLDDLFTTESVFMVHLGIENKDGYDPSGFQNGAALCYYYLTYDIDGSIRKCKKKIYHEGEDGFLVYIPSIHSPNMAPPEHDAVTIYTIAPNNPINGSWEKDKEKWAEKLLDIAEEHMPGLREHERTRVIITPEDLRKRTHLKNHAFGGTVPHLKIPPPPHKTPINGLWFIGAQSETYGGVVLGMIGADNVVKMILKDTKSVDTKQTFKKLSK